MITIEEFQADPAGSMRRVNAGETLALTERGAVFAELTPTALPPTFREATIHGRFEEIQRIKLDRPIEEVLDELRADRDFKTAGTDPSTTP
jgi:antitoxin (DNA-binding transcriptional repressor) of toxin-antitoxin stability system